MKGQLSMMTKNYMPSAVIPILSFIALGVLAISTSAGFFAGSRTDPAVNPLEKVTIACVPPPYTALIDIALAKGFSRQKGLEVAPRFHSTGKAGLDEVLAGKADFATVAATLIILAIMTGDRISLMTDMFERVTFRDDYLRNNIPRPKINGLPRMKKSAYS